MNLKNIKTTKIESIVPKATSVVNGKLSIPFVFTKEDNGIHGFVPGFVIKDVVSNNINDCHKLLSLIIKEEVLKRISEKDAFPFFPTDEQIYKDFDNVIKIKRETFEIPNI